MKTQTVKAVAARLNISPAWVRKLARRHGLGTLYHGVLFTEEEVKALREARRPPGNPNWTREV